MDKPLIERLNWPAVVLLVFLVLSIVCSIFGFLLAVPEHTQQKILELPWVVLGPMITAAIAAIWQAFIGPVVHPTASRAAELGGTPRSGKDGFASVELALLVCGFAGIVLACAALSGCAAGVREHAIAAHTLHEALDMSGTAIIEAERSQLEACPHDDTPERTLCVDHVEHVATVAAAARDLMVPLQQSYRRLTFDACSIDAGASPIVIPEHCVEPPPDVMSRIIEIAATLASDQAMLTAAIAALTGGH